MEPGNNKPSASLQLSVRGGLDADVGNGRVVPFPKRGFRFTGSLLGAGDVTGLKTYIRGQRGSYASVAGFQIHHLRLRGW